MQLWLWYGEKFFIITIKDRHSFPSQAVNKLVQRPLKVKFSWKHHKHIAQKYSENVERF